MAVADERKNPDEVFYDLKFRVKRKSGTYKELPAPAPALEAPIADSHCHLQMLSHLDLALARAAAYRVDFICDICDPTEDAGEVYAGLDGWRMAAAAWLDAIAPGEFFDQPRIRIACGVHPHNAKSYDNAVETRLLEKLRDPRTSCLGEVGLDFHYDLSPREAQRKAFRRQVQLAHRTGLVLSLHIREAHQEALAILDEEGLPEAGTILHCCTLGPAELEPWIERGCHIAYGGAITFNKLEDVREGARLVPEERLVLETDAPYMTPVPLRGVENGPEFAIFTAERLAAVRGIAPGEERRAFLEGLHARTVGLLDREPTTWQKRGR